VATILASIGNLAAGQPPDRSALRLHVRLQIRYCRGASPGRFGGGETLLHCGKPEAPGIEALTLVR